MRLSTIERAFELAGSGTLTKLEEVKRQLEREGYSNIHAHLLGTATKQKINRLLRATRERVLVDSHGVHETPPAEFKAGHAAEVYDDFVVSPPLNR